MAWMEKGRLEVFFHSEEVDDLNLEPDIFWFLESKGYYLEVAQYNHGKWRKELVFMKRDEPPEHWERHKERVTKALLKLKRRRERLEKKAER